ncbi:MAG: hypothetical protein K940chlam8_01138 [Chlamydiae bacterium]|nr:hypothetical protein [Chlamydiota bacterium]
MKLIIQKKLQSSVDVANPLIETLKKHFPKLTLKIQANRSSILTMQHSFRHLSVSMHHLFLDADHQMIEALVTYFKKGRGAKQASFLINAFIEEKRHLIEDKKEALITQGNVYDLLELYEKTKSIYFNDCIEVDVTYFITPLKRRRHITLGLYHRGIVKVNRVLDSVECPQYFVEFILYHEMLHHLFPTKMINGRRVMHSKEFRRKERAFKEYKLATYWQKNILLSKFLKTQSKKRKQDGRT